jgi:hypothetical protein
MNHYHILNGDALLEQFPPSVLGDKIVLRECLMDGPVQSDSLDELYEIRAAFLDDLIEDFNPNDYRKDAVSEFERIQSVSAGSTVYLWFEDDLFCQVNLWFACYLLYNHTEQLKVYLIRPKILTKFGFAAYDSAGLVKLFEEQTEFPCLETCAKLWSAYANNDLKRLQDIAATVSERFSFIKTAVKLHLDRLPNEDENGRPVDVLKAILEEVGDKDFSLIFKRFSEELYVYGYGDLQVKRMIKSIKL